MIPTAAQIETRLREQYGDGAVYQARCVTEEMSLFFQLTLEDLAESDGSHPRFKHKIHSALARHCRLGLLLREDRGAFRYLPEKLAEYQPHHHAPRPSRTRPSVAEAIRRLKRKRRAITLAIRELEQDSL